MAKSDRTTDLQFAALPYRFERGGLEILLITSRGRGRWLIPKGWPIENRKPHEVAEIEAFQEAGIKGKVGKKPIGTYPYAKFLPNGEERLCLVTVFPLRVTLEAVKWRERADRKRAWFSKGEAVTLVEEGGLAQIISEWR
ncbi:MAG TPA: NUDIX hydrolase [Acidisoma sp.]|jgi:8-oxo-dGTP pyrophosphatase MutT (NUDIX family)|nr:NUDIX hydrolase [Acidisoma sp.]